MTYHVLLSAHLNDFTCHEAELFVVIKHSVHVFNPDSINGAVEYKPLALIGGGTKKIVRRYSIIN